MAIPPWLCSEEKVVGSGKNRNPSKEGPALGITSTAITDSNGFVGGHIRFPNAETPDYVLSTILIDVEIYKRCADELNEEDKGA